MSVRLAHESDTEGALEIMQEAAAFADITTGEGVMNVMWDAVIAERLFLLHVKLNNSAAWVLEDESGGRTVGLLLANSFPHPYGNFRMAKESMWYISDSSRGNLRNAISMLRAFESWAESLGCRYVSMVSQSGYPQVDSLYRRLGYSPIETSYMKAI